MPIPLSEARVKVKSRVLVEDLVDRFARNLDAYKSADY